MAWCFDAEASPYADGVLDQLADRRAFVPAIWSLEVANVTLVGERRQRLDEARTHRFQSFLLTLSILLDEETGRRAFRETMALARAHNPSSYDAAYLELAVRRGLSIACLDGKLKAAATRVGVTLLTIE